ncbi:sugar phosphate isomerase/epimerase family protein [Telluribacter sp.]|jgi:sugar phosphate isomerase/epimerase|uniref:sugar phosphate isomerase/epimerase family protein n=1 Tax=Telluribacter sp. TaxID=1978767 RepID=UPI002E0F27F0|nr:sugar phosphate isomerase/epimerase family protein [Telluribacter sp.]
MQDNLSRRDFIQKAAVATGAVTTGAVTTGTLPFLTMDPVAAQPQAALPPVLIFSKHLQFLDYKEMAEKAAEIGFDGVDLTVRPGGHVLPERVKTDLPKAVEAIKKAGIQPLMMTTAVEDAKGTDEVLLKTAAEQGIKYYRMNWYKYKEKEALPDTLRQYKQQVTALSQLNKQLGLIGSYQNHAGKLVGASTWEIWQLLQGANPDHMGVQYDIRHATVEGGLSWENGLRLLHPHIKILAIKDFVWANQNGKWAVKNVPLGEGMVDFKTYFGLLKQYNVQVPISMHYEYGLGGAEHGSRTPTVDRQVIYDAMKRDLNKLKELWTQV